MAHRKVSRRHLLRGAAASVAGVATGSALAANEVSLIPNAKKPKFKVLSLDGGGARGYLTARILSNLELYLDSATGANVPLGQRFDFLVGTSTGGIIALGLATGRTAAEISAFYEKLVPTIFDEKNRRSGPVRLNSPKYDSQIIRKTLEDLFKDATLENVQTDVCITGVALQSGKPRFHKSRYQARSIGRQKEKLLDIALATSAAPTYFKAHNLKSSEKIIDGGICANNPSIVAIVDALNFERPSMTSGAQATSLSDIVLVSVGTGEQPSMPYDANAMAEAGLLGWAQHISDVMFESQSAIADFQAGFLLPNAYLRINPKLGKALPLDDINHLSDLKNISDLSRSHEVLIKKFFLEA
jgi:uncharacterized protein